MDEVFQFDSVEFQRHAPYRAVELNNGALLIAADDRFDEVFSAEVVNRDEGRVRFSTEGQVTNEYLRKQK